MPRRKNHHHGLIARRNGYLVVEMHRGIAAFWDYTRNIIQCVVDVSDVEIFARGMYQISYHTKFTCINAVALEDVGEAYLQYFTT